MQPPQNTTPPHTQPPSHPYPRKIAPPSSIFLFCLPPSLSPPPPTPTHTPSGSGQHWLRGVTWRARWRCPQLPAWSWRGSVGGCLSPGCFPGHWSTPCSGPLDTPKSMVITWPFQTQSAVEVLFHTIIIAWPLQTQSAAEVLFYLMIIALPLQTQSAADILFYLMTIALPLQTQLTMEILFYIMIIALPLQTQPTVNILFYDWQKIEWKANSWNSWRKKTVSVGVRIAQWLERWTRDRKVAGSNPFRSGGRIFFSRVNFLCWLLFWYLFHPCVTAVARKRLRSFCQKCRWQVTAKHTYTLHMRLCMKWHGAWLYGVHRMHRDGSSFTWHQPCQRCKYNTSVDSQKHTIKSYSLMQNHMLYKSNQ